MKILSAVFALLFAASAYASEPTLTFWYERPHYPGDGEYVTTTGVSTEKTSSDRSKVDFDFRDKTPDFQSLGGWMAQIQSIHGTVARLPKDPTKGSFYGQTSELFTVSFGDNTVRTFQMNCLHSQGENGARHLNCYFNGFDSITFEISN